MQKFIISCASILLGNAIGVFADSGCCPPKPCCQPVCCPEIEECCECNVCPPLEEITPNAGPCVKESMNFYVTADFTYWTAREDDLEFALTTGSDVAIGADAEPSRGKVYRPNTKWAPGFKVGLGHDLCFDGWDVYAEYTWYRLKNNSKTAEATENLELFDSYWFANSPANTSTTEYASADAKWRLNFNVVDLEVGRNFYISRRLMLRPFCGLKGFWEKQTYKVNFQDPLNSVFPIATVSMKNRMKNWGIGILAGVQTAWHISRSISLVGDLAISGLWEQFKVRRLDNQFIPVLDENTGNVNVSDSFHTIKPVVEWMLGARWEDWFGCDTYHLAFEAGWEEQHWFSQNQFIRMPGSAAGNNGDLVFQGLTIKARIDF